MKVILLSEDFYSDYGHFPEILKKNNRPYACLAVKIEGVTFAIPFRHKISHSHSLITYGSCGLDYTKAVVVVKPCYISSHHPKIEQKEYNFLKSKERAIVSGMKKYVKLYKKAKSNYNSPYYANILKYSTLQYFEDYTKFQTILPTSAK